MGVGVGNKEACKSEIDDVGETDGVGVVDSNLLNCQPVVCRDNDHHRIAPIVVKATKMAINSSNPKFLDGDES